MFGNVGKAGDYMRLIKRLLLIVVILLIGLAPSTQLVEADTTPTIFVHGYRGTAFSTNQLIEGAEAAGVAKRSMVITVSPTGQLDVRGTLHTTAAPIIQVIFQNNTAGEEVDSQWLAKIFTMLHERYGVVKLNAVGHSMGAYAVIAAAMAQTPIELEKVVAIAGPYDGLLGWNDQPHQLQLAADGRPNLIRPEYARLLKNRTHFRAKSVLNIYGNVQDGTDTDTVVSVNSALSLGYLLRGLTKYQTLEVTGPHAQHSQLHEHNVTVDRAMLQFIWGK